MKTEPHLIAAATAHAALVTGASAGIGASFARLLAADGFDLLLVARRAERLHTLADDLRKKHGVRVEVFAADLTDPGAPAEVMAFADEQGLSIDVLINNAGMATTAAFADATWPALANELQLMVTAVTELAHRVIPGMKARGGGRIVNLSSLAAFSPPGQSLLYSGIKSYVLNMSQSLDMELKPHGIHVTALCPGFTHSEFHDAMGTREAASRLPSILWQQPEDVVREGWSAVNRGKPICIPGRVNKVLANVTRPIPFGTQYVLGRKFNPFA
jgi:short-subunit dehydrogenase